MSFFNSFHSSHDCTYTHACPHTHTHNSSSTVNLIRFQKELPASLPTYPAVLCFRLVTGSCAKYHNCHNKQLRGYITQLRDSSPNSQSAVMSTCTCSTHTYVYVHVYDIHMYVYTYIHVSTYVHTYVQFILSDFLNFFLLHFPFQFSGSVARLSDRQKASARIHRNIFRPQSAKANHINNLMSAPWSLLPLD